MSLIKGKKILVTKSADECGAVFNNLVSQGAEIIYFPTIKILPKYHELDLSDLIINADQFEFVVFTSANAVDIFSMLVNEYRPDLSRTKVAAVGRTTAEACRSHGIYVHLIPDEFSAKGLIDKFSGLELIGKKILIPGSSISRGELKIGLSELGAEVVTLPIYDVIYIEPCETKIEFDSIKNHRPDIYVFTSPSSFNGFIKIVGEQNLNNYFSNKLICAIGNTTEEAIRKNGFIVNIVPQTFSLKGVAETITKFFSKTFNAA